MKDFAFSIPTRDPVRIAFKHLVSDFRFMATHGWTKEAYIQRYGTTQKPKMGDGGPLIWQADVYNHHRLRCHFCRVANHCRTDPMKPGHSAARKLFSYLMSPRETARWDALVVQAMGIGKTAKELKAYSPRVDYGWMSTLDARRFSKASG